MKVYIVTDGCYSDYTIRGVFSTEEKAKEYAAFFNDANEIEEYDLDAPFDFPTGMKPCNVHMGKDGNGNIYWTDPEGFRESAAKISISYHGTPFLYRSMWARDKEHALKSTNEIRAMMIATGEWDRQVQEKAK